MHRAAIRAVVELGQMTAFERRAALAWLTRTRLPARGPVVCMFGGVVVRACACFGPFSPSGTLSGCELATVVLWLFCSLTEPLAPGMAILAALHPSMRLACTCVQSSCCAAVMFSWRHSVIKDSLSSIHGCMCLYTPTDPRVRECLAHAFWLMIVHLSDTVFVSTVNPMCTDPPLQASWQVVCQWYVLVALQPPCSSCFPAYAASVATICERWL